ncbi:hypothetical protein K227x_25290 [Rubripirellula lacrimiformis]|uniref:Protein kinase domain-containing protein n=1 Tax=Rubripirellula lacrimiformis TaxID=1930273 RepID=A0A517NAI8_9BACT|nr:hypothetical protein [Rubripirellula lacrimiformis]QDT04140.1 hypothetical protein K227x_25290 [Rubripirellula lacrimiformis]
MDLPVGYEEQIEEYCQKHLAVLRRSLGTGTQGTVFTAKNPRHLSLYAVKFHLRQVAYDREVGVYLRLQDLDASEVCGHQVPQLLGHDDDLLAIEMSTVRPPFCLDFGGAYLDQPPDYSPEVWRDWREEKSEDFEDNWPTVEKILAEFRWMGIHIADVNPGNIRF